MSETNNSGNIITPKVRMSYPHLLQPQVYRQDPTSRPTFSVVGLFPEGQDWPEGRQACFDAAVAEWGPDPEKWPKNPPKDASGEPQPIETPFKDQGIAGYQSDGNLKPGYVKGGLMIQPTTGKDYPPIVVGPDGRTRVTEAREIYGGRWARFSVRARAWTFGKKHGVKFYLQAVQLLDHDEPFGSRGEPEKEFAPVEIAAPAPGGGDTSQVFGSQQGTGTPPQAGATPPAANPFG